MPGRGAGLSRLYRDDHQVDAFVGRIGVCADSRYAVAACAFDTQSFLVDRIHVFQPSVDGHHIVPAGGKQAGIYGPHGAASYDGYLHFFLLPISTSELSRGASSAFCSSPNPGASVGRTTPSPRVHASAYPPNGWNTPG